MRAKVFRGSADRVDVEPRTEGRRWERRLSVLALLLATYACAGLAEPQNIPGADQANARWSALAEEGVPRASGVAQPRFLRGRTLPKKVAAASALAEARGQHAAMAQAQAVQPRYSALNARWQAVGPGQIASMAYGRISGRVSSVAIDPADGTGNTVYVGTTGGGLWKSTNAAGPAEAVTFQPLTDNLSVFSGSAGSAATASLSLGAVSAQAGGIVLAGTGDPNDASDSYYGSGVLRSMDGGLTWSLVPGSQDGDTGQHSFAGLGFAGFAWSTVNPGLVVAAVSQSAEGVLVNAMTRNSVMGLYASSDGGATWRLGTISDGSIPVLTPMPSGMSGAGFAATSVVWNPVRQRFYAALRYHGYYESADGMSWTRLAHQPGTGLTTVACPAILQGGISVSCPIFRGSLAVQPVSGDLFAVTTDRNNVDQGLWRDTCGATGGGCASGTVNFATQISSSALETSSTNKMIPQADYDLSLAAQPVGGDTVLYVGTGDLYRCSLAGGCALRNTTNATNGCAAPAAVAPSQHAIAALANSGLVYVGNDAGLWRSTDNVGEQGAACSADDKSHFANLNGGFQSLAEVVSLAEDPVSAGNLLVGLGASGTVSSAGDPAGVWPQVSAGEGGTVAIDPTNPLLWYISTAGGVSLRSCTLGAQCRASDFAGVPTIGAAQTGVDVSLLDAPWILDPGASANVVVGTCRVWRGPAGSGASWSGANAISAMLGGPQNAACSATTNPVIRALAAGGAAVRTGAAQSTGSTVLYAGMAGALDGGGAYAGHVFSTAHADTSSSTTRWTDVSVSRVSNDFVNSGAFNPAGFDISSVTADAHDATGMTVYATVMGFSGNGVSAPHVYGSIDGGAHWQNLSSNLPNAPANGVVVDPNDANTVYVALDTGVYVTTQISSCPMQNCWSVYGLSLPNSPVTQMLASASLPTGDGRIGLLRAGTYGRGIWEIPLLTATYPAQPAMTIAPTTVVFADQAQNSLSAAQTVTITNSGNAPLLVSRVAATGDFQTTDSCTGSTVGLQASCTVQVRFLPSAQGLRTGMLTVYGNVSGGQGTATLTGDGTAPGDLVMTPLSVSFAATAVGATSAVQYVTISNTGGAPVTLQAPTVTGDFRMQANTCGSSLAPGTGCTVGVMFSPTVSGSRTGDLQVVGGSGTLTAPLSGTGTNPATDGISPGSLTFATQQIGTASAVQQVVLSNAGDVALTLIAARIGSGNFVAVSGCGASLNAHATCSIAVSYVPKGLGAETGTLVISDQFRSQTVSLNGIGVAPPGVSLSPSGAMSFAATAVGVRSAAQTVTLTNNGGLPLTVQSVGVSGDFVTVAGGSCGAILAPATSCTLTVAFAPTAGGVRTGSLTIADDAPTSPQTVALTGMGVDFQLGADGSTSATVASGKSATFPLLLQSAAGTSGRVSFSCTGAPANATCTVSPTTAALGASTLVSATVVTGVSATVAQRGGERWGDGAGWALALAGVGPISLAAMRRRRVAVLLGVLGVVAVGGLSGCGSGRAIPAMVDAPTTGGAATPAGSYALTVSATSAGLTRSMSLSLTVQ